MTRQLFVCFLLALLVAAALAFENRPVFAQSACGMKPIPPIPPIGCKSVVPVCSCDLNGQNCHWIFECIR